MEVPTANEVLISTTPSMISCESCLEAMRQYAWLHVQAALIAACDNAEINGDYGSDYPTSSLDRGSILNAYPIENIV